MFLGITKVRAVDSLVSLLSDKGNLRRHPSELLNCKVSILAGTWIQARLILHEELTSWRQVIQSI